ncbi:MAG TPA: hypothetical protein VHP38_16075 [Ruminiclostridium sp.]|nr:hypothetical protein [Ruminiclostridium sp.]
MMPSENKTINYGLNQWLGNEYAKREDFNTDNAIIDTELKGVNDKTDSKISKTLATAANQFLLSSAVGQWTIKSIAEIKTLLGLKSAAEKEFNTTGGVAAYDTVLTHLSDYVRQPGYAVTTGSANTYAVTLSPAPTAYTDGMGIVVKINAANTGAATININSLGAKAIVDGKGNALVTGKLRLNGTYSLKYNSTSGNFILQGEGGSGNAVASDLLSGKTASTDAGDIVGNMPNKGAVTITPSNADQAIPAGYHNGSGKVSAITGTATIADVVAGKTFASAAGANLVGTFVVKGWYKGTASQSYYGAFIWDDAQVPYTYGLEVPLNLSFTPKTIIIWDPGSKYLHVFYSDEVLTPITASGYRAIQGYSNGGHNYVLDGTYAYLNSSGFRMPVGYQGSQYTFLIIG